MIKGYFKSNTNYVADDLNNIIKSLRTDGINGEVSGSLTVTLSSGTIVSIADGIGWRDGCMIEVTSGETLTLPTTSGIYSVFIDVQKSGNLVSSVGIDFDTGEIDEPYVLAWVTVSGGAITNVVDKRKPSVFNGKVELVTTPWKSIEFRSSGKWLCPPGVEYIDAWVVGGGGGGAGGAQNFYGGGGGGGYCNLFENIPVAEGGIYDIVVGSGGNGGSTTDGSNGGYSQFHISDYRSNGGNGGIKSTSSAHGTGGAGGNNGGTFTTHKDGYENHPDTINPYSGLPFAGGGGTGDGKGGSMGGGGGGAGGNYGTGGLSYNNEYQNGTNGYRDGNNYNGGSGATNTGAGGGGGTYNGTSGYYNGGRSGGSGIVIIYYKQL